MHRPDLVFMEDSHVKRKAISNLEKVWIEALLEKKKNLLNSTAVHCMFIINLLIWVLFVIIAD